MKILFFILVVFCALKTNAQNYLITFNGSGASDAVSTVNVENLTKGTSLTLNGSDILRLTGTTGISQVDYGRSFGMKIYPNPMTDNSIMEIFPPVAGDAIITVFDMTGKLIAQIKSYLENYPREFRLSGISSGLFFISVKGNTYQYSGKLLCSGKADGTITIEKIYSNQAAEVKTAKTDYKGSQATVDMEYTTGDRLKFTGISGIYSTIRMDIPVQDKTITFNFILCKDNDNNNYATVQIGTGKSGSQVWMAENLKTTKYNDGTNIPLVADNEAWTNLNTPGYCWYNNDASTYKNTYGALYNWYSVNTGILCPTGWHVPSDTEWTTLTTFLDGESVAGGKLKKTGISYWQNPNTGATNETGFTALPGGYRSSGAIGLFYVIGFYGNWWSSTGYDVNSSWYRYLGFSYNYVYRGYYYKKDGYSVRCLKD
jgi:uncharacterized protein (TIGR02145 family)